MVRRDHKYIVTYSTDWNKHIQIGPEIDAPAHLESTLSIDTPF